MANANRPSGLAPVQYLNGAPWNGQGRVYSIPETDDTNPFAIGDPVASNGDADTNGIPGIALATGGTGNLIRGVVVGVGVLQAQLVPVAERPGDVRRVGVRLVAVILRVLDPVEEETSAPLPMPFVSRI